MAIGKGAQLCVHNVATGLKYVLLLVRLQLLLFVLVCNRSWRRTQHLLCSCLLVKGRHTPSSGHLIYIWC
jgi:hypothetical protein